jgi:hypothetical protein
MAWKMDASFMMASKSAARRMTKMNGSIFFSISIDPFTRAGN